MDAIRDRTLDDGRERNSSVPLQNSGETPATRNLIEWPVQCKLAPVPKRELINDLTD